MMGLLSARDAQNVSRSPSSTAIDMNTHLAVKYVVILSPYRPDLTRWLLRGESPSIRDILLFDILRYEDMVVTPTMYTWVESSE